MPLKTFVEGHQYANTPKSDNKQGNRSIGEEQKTNVNIMLNIEKIKSNDI